MFGWSLMVLFWMVPASDTAPQLCVFPSVTIINQKQQRIFWIRTHKNTKLALINLKKKPQALYCNNLLQRQRSTALHHLQWQKMLYKTGVQPRFLFSMSPSSNIPDSNDQYCYQAFPSLLEIIWIGCVGGWRHLKHAGWGPSRTRVCHPCSTTFEEEVNNRFMRMLKGNPPPV